MHMHPCPPARSGVATRKGACSGRGISRPAQAPLLGAEGWGNPVRRRQLYPCAARGAAPLGSVFTTFRERDRYRLSSRHFLGQWSHVPSGPGFRTDVLAGAKGVGVSVPFRAHEIHSRHEPARAPVRRQRFLRRGSAPLQGVSLRFGHRGWRNVLKLRDSVRRQACRRRW